MKKIAFVVLVLFAFVQTKAQQEKVDSINEVSFLSYFDNIGPNGNLLPKNDFTAFLYGSPNDLVYPNDPFYNRIYALRKIHYPHNCDLLIIKKVTDYNQEGNDGQDGGYSTSYLIFKNGKLVNKAFDNDLESQYSSEGGDGHTNFEILSDSTITISSHTSSKDEASDSPTDSATSIDTDEYSRYAMDSTGTLVLKIEDTTSTESPSTLDALKMNIDVNFDGYADEIEGLESENDIVDNFGVSCSLFDPRTKQYEHSDRFSKLINPSFDKRNKIINERYYTHISQINKSYKLVKFDSLQLVQIDTIWFTPVIKLDYIEPNDLQPLSHGWGCPIDIVIHKFPMAKKNIDVYEALALKYSDSESDWNSNEISKFITKKLTEKFPNRPQTWRCLGDVLYNGLTFSKDHLQGNKMYNSYKKYIQLMKAQGKENQIPQQVYDRMKGEEAKTIK